MTTLKNLMIAGALLVVGGSGPFCAAANELPDSSNGSSWPSVAAPPSPAAYIPPRTARHHGTRHHRMYMMSLNRSSKLTPTSNAKPQVKQ
jgi:hypothetical protein